MIRKTAKTSRVVLEEQEYLASLEKIISRDYYPDLDSLHRDLARLRGCSVEGRELHLNDQDFGTSRTSNPNTAQLPSVHHVEEGMGLNEFFSKYTSEDNDSFQTLLSDDLAQRRRQFHWAYPINTTGKPQDSNSEHNYREGMLMLYYLKEDKALSAKERREMDLILCSADKTITETERYGILTEPKFQVRNTLFFPPEAAVDVKLSGDLFVSSNNCRKRIVSANTRFPSLPTTTAYPDAYPYMEGPHSPSVYSLSENGSICGFDAEHPLGTSARMRKLDKSAPADKNDSLGLLPSRDLSSSGKGSIRTHVSKSFSKRHTTSGAKLHDENRLRYKRKESLIRDKRRVSLQSSPNQLVHDNDFVSALSCCYKGSKR